MTLRFFLLRLRVLATLRSKNMKITGMQSDVILSNINFVINHMKNSKKIIPLILLIICLFSCGGNKNKVSESTDGKRDFLKYAKGFTIEHFDNYTLVSVLNPASKDQPYGRYYLYKNSGTEIPDGGTKIMIPLNNMAATSATHFEFMQLIGEIDKITGICDADRVYNPTILNGVKSGKITDLGDSFSINFEKLLGLRPAAVMMSGFAQQDENSLRISRTGLPVLYNNEWMEKSLLARAEWIKFVAAFFDRSDIADSIFNEIEKKYNEVSHLADNIKDKPNIVTGNDFRGTWYVPGGQSYAAELYRNAGGNYFYQNDTTTGSIPLNMETALKNFIDADVWLWCTYKNMDELKSMNERYTLFKAFKTGNVYGNMKRSTPTGGNDYWESAVARPDIILQDVIKVLHPELLPDHELFYLEKLK